MTASARPAAGATLTFDDLLHAVRRTWRSSLMWGAVALSVGALAGALRPKRYTARASFVAEQQRVRNLPSGLGALAAQFGLDVAGDAGRSPQFYRDLVETSGLLLGVLDSTVVVAPGESLSVRHLAQGAADGSRASLDQIIRRLRKQISAQADPRTSIVTVIVSERTPVAAESFAGLLIRSIKRFNVTTRQLQARELRIFLEKRVSDASQGLHDAEDGLRTFYERNRRFGDSPQLIFEESRMKRQIELHQELFTALSKELESAKIDEVNDTPTITVVDPPFASSRPDGPGLVALALVALVLGIGARGGWLVLAGR